MAHSPRRWLTAGYRTSHRSCNPEARIFRADAGNRGVAIGRTQQPGVVVPGAPTEDAQAAIRGFDCRAVRRCTLIAVLVAVLHPLPDVAVHVVEAEGVPGQRPHVERFLPVHALGTLVVS